MEPIGAKLSQVEPNVAQCSPVHNVLFGQYLFLATEQGEINTIRPNYDIIQHILIPPCSGCEENTFYADF